MTRRCPWCLEKLKRNQRALPICPHCEHPLLDESGAELRPLDLRYEQVRAEQRELFFQLEAWGTGAVACLCLLMSLFHPLAVIGVPLLLVGHALVLGIGLTRPARRLLGARRMLFVRWVQRLSFVWIGVPGYGLSLLPGAGALVGAGTFAGLTAISHQYTLWSLRQERERCPPPLWETLLIVTLLLVTLVAVVVLGALAVAIGWSLDRLVDWMHSLL